MLNQQGRIMTFAGSKPRSFGGLLMVLGAVLFYFSLIWPLLQRKQAQITHIYEAGVIGGAIFFVVGLTAIILGPAFIHNPHKKRSMPAKIVIFLMVVAVVMIFIFLMPTIKDFLQGLGFVFVNK